MPSLAKAFARASRRKPSQSRQGTWRAGLADTGRALAAVLEAFTFQILRHTGAVLGCDRCLGDRQSRGKQQRHGVA